MNEFTSPSHTFGKDRAAAPKSARVHWCFPTAFVSCIWHRIKSNAHTSIDPAITQMKGLAKRLHACAHMSHQSGLWFIYPYIYIYLSWTLGTKYQNKGPARERERERENDIPYWMDFNNQTLSWTWPRFRMLCTKLRTGFSGGTSPSSSLSHKCSIRLWILYRSSCFKKFMINVLTRLVSELSRFP